MENYYLVDLKELQCYLNFQVKKIDEEKIKGYILKINFFFPLR